MFIDVREIENEATPEADLCLIGGGAAGITIVRALIGSGRWVKLLEGSGFGFDDQTQSFYEATNLRFHGSTSTLGCATSARRSTTGPAIVERLIMERATGVLGVDLPGGVPLLARPSAARQPDHRRHPLRAA